jgi:hypothetical protein
MDKTLVVSAAAGYLGYSYTTLLTSGLSAIGFGEDRPPSGGMT